MDELCVVIPALNEMDTISQVISGAKKYGHVIVVDDGSTDQTAAISSLAGAIVIKHKTNMGYEEALNSGFRKASELGCPIIITLDADGQHDTNLIDQFISKINSGCDVVIGVRNKRQRFAEHIFSIMTKKLYSIDDPLCGIKAYKRDVYESLGFFDSYNSVGTELALFAVNSGYRIGQINLRIHERTDQPRYGSRIKANFLIFRALVRHLIS